jgi:GNAT superfamily N-acetyltransferase
MSSMGEPKTPRRAGDDLDSMVVGTAERDRALATLHRAFASDPVVRWVLPDADRYDSFYPRIVVALGGAAFDHRTAIATPDLNAVALWLGPGVEADGATIDALVHDAASPSRHATLDRFFDQADAFHPHANHWYLPLIGVDPQGQGRGLGSSLVASGLKAPDREGLPCYLEATSARSRDFYAGFGFIELGVIQDGDSPPMWPMLRSPRV